MLVSSRARSCGSGLIWRDSSCSSGRRSLRSASAMRPATTSVSRTRQQLAAIQPAAAPRTADLRPDVVRAADAHVGPAATSSARASSVSSSARSTTIGSDEGSSASASRRDGPKAVSSGQPLADRPGTRAPAGCARRSSRHRPIAGQPETPRPVGPVRPGVVDADRAARLATDFGRPQPLPGAPATGRRPEVRSWPSSRRSIASAWVSRAGPLHSRSVGVAGPPRRARMTASPSTGSSARRSTAPATRVFRACHDVQAVMHAVDKVDVRVADRAVHRCRARGQPGAGMAGQIGRPAVCLGLDDPPDRELAVKLGARPGCRADRARPRRVGRAKKPRSSGASAATPSPRESRSG